MTGDADALINTSRPFLAYLVEWYRGLTPLSLAALVSERDAPRVAVAAVDVINGFCTTGPLASPRVARIVPPVVALHRLAYDLGVRHFLFIHDAHDPAAPEFSSYPPHAVRGSVESAPVPELTALPFFEAAVTRIPKNSVDSAAGTTLDPWLDTHPEVDTFVVVGDCTDICVYLLAMHLRTRADAANRPARIIVPADCVDTYDLPVSSARETGATPHAADLLHLVFLHQMRLNGIEVVARIV
jgi:nicotinamidase-related amidase